MYSIYPLKHLRTHHFASSQQKKILVGVGANPTRNPLPGLVACTAKKASYAPVTDNAWASNETLELFTDSAGGQNRGFGIYFQGKWVQKCWPKEWEEMGILKDITFLELFPVVVALCIWGEQLKNKKIIFNLWFTLSIKSLQNLLELCPL